MGDAAQYSLPLSRIGDWPTHDRFRQAGAGWVAHDLAEVRQAIVAGLTQPDAQRPARAGLRSARDHLHRRKRVDGGQGNTSPGSCRQRPAAWSGCEFLRASSGPAQPVQTQPMPARFRRPRSLADRPDLKGPSIRGGDCGQLREIGRRSQLGVLVGEALTSDSTEHDHEGQHAHPDRRAGLDRPPPSAQPAGARRVGHHPAAQRQEHAA